MQSCKQRTQLWPNTELVVCLTSDLFITLSSEAGTEKPTCVHLSVLGGRPFRDHALHLQELVGLVPPDDGEPEAHVALLQGRRQEAALQLGGVPREQRLLCRF